MISLIWELDDFLHKTEREQLKANKSIESFNDLFNVEIY